MAVRGTVVLLATLALDGCNGAAHPNVASTTTTESTPTTTSTTPPPTQSTPKPKAPSHTPRTHHAPLPPGSGSQTVETVTSNGEVLVLDNGDVYSVSSGDASSWEGEAVHVSEDESHITKDDNGDQIEVSKVGDTSSGESYSGTGDEQDTNSSDGAILVLNDGSVWAVENADQATARLWLDRTAIHVSEEESGGLGTYVLHNTDDHESVTATYIGNK